MPAYSKTGRAPSYGRGRYARSASTPRRSIPTPTLRRRREPEPTGLKKVVRTVGSTAAAKKVAPRSKKGMAGGVALLAAAAGVAIKNRDRLRRSESGADAPVAHSGNTSQPSAEAAV